MDSRRDFIKKASMLAGGGLTPFKLDRFQLID